jgi:hypothetical protein
VLYTTRAHISAFRRIEAFLGRLLGSPWLLRGQKGVNSEGSSPFLGTKDSLRFEVNLAIGSTPLGSTPLMGASLPRSEFRSTVLHR